MQNNILTEVVNMENEFFRKIVLTGVGLADLTVEKAENLVKELVKRGEVVEGESKKYVDDLMKKAKDAEENFKTKVEEILKEKQYVTKEAFDEVSKKLDEVLKKLDEKK